MPSIDSVPHKGHCGSSIWDRLRGQLRDISLWRTICLPSKPLLWWTSCVKSCFWCTHLGEYFSYQLLPGRTSQIDTPGCSRWLTLLGKYLQISAILEQRTVYFTLLNKTIVWTMGRTKNWRESSKIHFLQSYLSKGFTEDKELCLILLCEWNPSFSDLFSALKIFSDKAINIPLPPLVNVSGEAVSDPSAVLDSYIDHFFLNEPLSLHGGCPLRDGRFCFVGLMKKH